MRKSIGGLVGVVWIATAFPASATPLMFTFTGRVTFVDTVINTGPVAVGDLLTGTFVFDDTAVLDVPNSSANFARYASPAAPLSALIGSYAVSGDAEMAVWNDAFGEDNYQVITNNQWDFPQSSLVAASIVGFAPYAFVLNFEDHTATAVDSLTLVPPDFTKYTGRRFDLNLLDENNNFADLYGTVDSLSPVVAAVPEPASFVLAGLGLVLIAGFVVRRHSEAPHSRVNTSVNGISVEPI